MKPSPFIAALATNMLISSVALALDQDIPNYQSVSRISGQIKSVGSDTLNNVMILWAKGFKGRYPDVEISVEGKGSATAPPALLQGTAQFAPMSRGMTAEEMDAFEAKYGYKASSILVAVDALSIYVNKDNPIQCLTLQEINRIFSSTRKVSFGGNIKTWGELGLTGEWASRPITMYGRNSLSGTYEFFRQNIMYGGEYKPEVKQQVGSEEVVAAVSNDRFAIGYSGIGYKSEGVRTVPVALYAGRDCYDTSAEVTMSGHYPIARGLYVYVNRKPNQPLDPLRGEFIKYILSKDGQTQTEMGGFYPITNKLREGELRKLGLLPSE